MQSDRQVEDINPQDTMYCTKNNNYQIKTINEITFCFIHKIWILFFENIIMPIYSIGKYLRNITKTQIHIQFQTQYIVRKMANLLFMKRGDGSFSW